MFGVSVGIMDGAGGAAGGSYESIATAVGTGSSDSITFSSIPSSYKHLQIRYFAKCNSATGAYLRFNSDSGNNYAWHYLDGQGSVASAAGYAPQPAVGISPPESGIGSSQFSVGIIDIIDYASTTKNKTTRTFTGIDVNGVGGDIALNSGLWRNTAAITTILFTTLAGGNFTSDSVFSLYGIKG
jgi:hypothetical protein